MSQWIINMPVIYSQPHSFVTSWPRIPSAISVAQVPVQILPLLLLGPALLQGRVGGWAGPPQHPEWVGLHR